MLRIQDLTEDEEEELQMHIEELLDLDESWDRESAKIDGLETIEAARANYDPTPYCSLCKAKTKEFCKCPPTAANE